MRKLISRVLSLGLILGMVGKVSAQSEDAKLETFFKSYLDRAFSLRPMQATELGDHRFDAQLEDLASEARAKWLEHTRVTLTELPKKIDYQKLTRAGQIDYDILQHSLQRDEWLTENIHPYEEDPRVYNGYINDSVYLVLTQSTLPLETNVANCIARMAQIPKVAAAARQNLKNPPRAHTETAIRQNRGAIGFYDHDIFEFVGKTRQLEALKAAAQTVSACLKDYQKYLETDLLPQANGEWRIGSEKFARKLDLELDAGVSADQVMADAEAEFARVERDMYVIARQGWAKYFPAKALPPDDEAGRRTTVREVLAAVAQNHCRPQDLTREMKQRVERLKKFITSNDILRLPDPDHCQVIEMPEFKRGNSTAYMEAPAPLDPNGTGHLAVSPPPKDWDAQRINSYLEEYNNYMLDILTIHEGYPGHSVQLEYMNRNPSLIRRVLQSGVYIEGWAVYTEQMMLDQGYGAENLALRLNQLKFYLRAVGNTILDHKMHCANFSDEEALKFLTQDCFQSEGEAKLKIIRSKQSSCQLSTYFVGRMAHYRLRQLISRELGDKFVLGRYHEAVLEPGAVPVKYLTELVRARLGVH
ncbi:MAG TPA: DUF885 domain-containing protein [Candidatus Limnocylindrales bacterium]|nr:DUF885 domain-containing protein [Candidatus Limnocylindrales bacterium]